MNSGDGRAALVTPYYNPKLLEPRTLKPITVIRGAVLDSVAYWMEGWMLG